MFKPGEIDFLGQPEVVLRLSGKCFQDSRVELRVDFEVLVRDHG